MSADVPADPPPFTVDIRVEQRARLTTADIWPDGDGPARPTVADVIAALKQFTDEPRDLLSNWDDVEIFVEGARVHR